MLRWAFVAWVVLGVAVSGASAQLSTVTADVLIEDHPEIVRQGYERERWRYQEILWSETLECWGRGSLLGAKATCLVCSIDATAGDRDLRINRPKVEGLYLPGTSVGIQASYAYFSLRPWGWTLERYKPFAVSLYARNYEPFHRSNVRNLSMGPAQRECRDLEAVSGTE